MIGETIGKYQITAKLGEGGMGVVYKAVDITLEREVAIKMLHPALTTEPELKTRFHNEAKINAKLNHPAIITLYDFFFENNSYFIAMEFVQGKTGEDIVNEIGPISYQKLLPIFRQVTSGLAYAHKQGVIHRDIKPSNIMITDLSDVKVMDFGIARIMGSQRMTSTGVAVGSLLYMSPEQIKNQNVDHRSDIYALGITLFEMATGKVPFDSSAGSEYEIMQKHIEAVVPSPKSIYPHIPENIESAIIKATQKAPEDRFQTMEEFGAALDMGKVEVTPSPASTKFEISPQKPVIDDKGTSKPSVETKKRSLMALIAGIIIILLVTGGGIYFYKAPKPLPKPKPIPKPELIAEISDALASAKKALAGKNYDQAKRFFEKVLVIDPQNIQALTSLKEIKEIEASRQKRKAIDSALASAKKALAGKNYDQAKRFFEKVLALDPENIKAGTSLKEIKEIEEQIKQLSTAEKYIRNGRFVSPKGANAFEIYERFLSTENSGISERAHQGLREILNKGNNFIERDKLEKARKICSALLKSSDADIKNRASQAMARIGREYARLGGRAMGKGDCVRAKKCFEKALSLIPADEDVIMLLRRVEESKGTLSIYCEPWANIIIDGVDVRRTAPADGLKLICGTHKVKLVNPEDSDYSSREAEINITVNKTTKLIVIRNEIRTLIE